jgi:glycosyltransferase involved in cell wall biosynthesis
LESRKRPVELVQAFELLALKGHPASLVMVGRPSASDESINRAVADVEARGFGVTWIRDAGDVEIARLMEEADAFLSFGTEGYGIPVLEALRLGTPVLFGGIQPAAELMEGSGAVRVDDGGAETIADSLSEWVSFEALRSLRNGIDTRAIPTWANFAEAVVAIL